MPRTEPAAAPRRTWLIPLVFSLGLLLALAFAVYRLYSENMQLEAQELARKQAAATEQQAALQKEKAALRHLLEQPPCEAQKSLQGMGGLSALSPLEPQATPLARAQARSEKVAAQQQQGGQKETAQAVTPTPETAKIQAVPDAHDAVTLLEKACVFVLSLHDSKSLSTGSGFFVAPGYVITNSHVVGKSGKVLLTSKALGRPVAGKVIARDQRGGRDYALIRADMPAGSSIAIPAFARTVRRTEKVGAWGFPHVIGQNDPAYKKLLTGKDISAVPELAYSEGVVSAVLERMPPLVVHTAPISPGNSGGPLVNAQGQIVGINTMITLDEESYRQASIALTGQDLQEFLRRHDVSISLAP